MFLQIRDQAIDIIIHIGHGKTGTSAIQSFLAKNTQLLREYNFIYPQDESTEHASLGYISSGNRAAFVTATKFDSDVNYLFSNEAFFDDIDKRSHVFEKFLTIKSRLKVILFTRDLFEFTFSNWGQSIKRGGSQSDIHSFCQNAHNMYLRVERVIKTLQAENIAFEVFNYSHHKRHLEASFLSIIAPEVFHQIHPKAKTFEHPVNRSLTLAEYELQRLFNRYYGSTSSDFISDELVNKLPNTKTQQPNVEPEVAHKLVQKAKSSSVFINQFLADSEHLSLHFDDSTISNSPPTEFTFSTEQLEVLADAISTRLKKSEQVTITQKDVEVLRDVALTFENKTKINKKQAIHLMQVAARARPDGPIIKQMLTKWLGKLNSK